MKQVHASYTFVASTKTITLTGLNIDQDQLLLIVNATRGVQYFNFADSSLRGTVTSGANTTVVLTDASTTGHANGDALVIYYDDQQGNVVSGTVTANPGTGAFTVSGTVGLDPSSLAALENVTVTVGAAVSVSNFPASQVVSVSNLPASQTVAGTVTANINGTVPVSGTFWQNTQPVSLASLPTSTVTVSNFPATQTIAGSVTVANFPDTQRIGFVAPGGNSSVAYNQGLPVDIVSIQSNLNPLPISGTVTIGSLPPISGTVTASVVNSVTIGVLPNGSVFGGEIAEGFAFYGGVAISSLPSISGTVTAAAPNGTLTTRFGSVTTANTAFATSAVTNASRKYLLIQNVTTGSNVITVGIGFTPTTTQGIQLTAGAGITFESSYIPTGAVQILSSVTQSNFTILEA